MFYPRKFFTFHAICSLDEQKAGLLEKIFMKNKIKGISTPIRIIYVFISLAAGL